MPDQSANLSFTVSHLLPGTEVHARGLRWEIVFSQQLGAQTLYRLRGLENAVRRQSELGANPFDAIPIAIASIDFLKQETVLDLLERSSYDVIVVDEAHHCATCRPARAS